MHNIKFTILTFLLVKIHINIDIQVETHSQEDCKLKCHH